MSANNLWVQGASYKACPAGCSWWDAFHVYGVQYNESHMVWTLDGSPYLTRAIGPSANSALVAPTWPMTM